VAKKTTGVPAKANEKNIYITFICVGLLAWFPLSSLMLNIFDLLAQWVPNPKLLGVVQLSNLVSIILCGLIVLGMVRSKAIYQFTNEVFMELGKVSWPIKKGTGISQWEKYREIRESTIVVIVSIAALAVFISIVDIVFQTMVRIIF